MQWSGKAGGTGRRSAVPVSQNISSIFLIWFLDLEEESVLSWFLRTTIPKILPRFLVPAYKAAHTLEGWSLFCWSAGWFWRFSSSSLVHLIYCSYFPVDCIISQSFAVFSKLVPSLSQRSHFCLFFFFLLSLLQQRWERRGKNLNGRLTRRLTRRRPPLAASFPI